MRHFILGFLLGAFSMYWYQGNADTVLNGALNWVDGAATSYTGPAKKVLSP